MAKRGSVTLLVVMVLALLTTIGFSILRTTTFLVDGALMREKYTKQYYATEALIRYGIGLGQLYFDEFKKQEKEIEVDVGVWPQVNSLYKGKLVFIPEEKKVKIQALLEKDSHIYCTIGCQLSSENDTFQIYNWKIGS